jgi:hypothetical protein
MYTPTLFLDDCYHLWLDPPPISPSQRLRYARQNAGGGALNAAPHNAPHFAHGATHHPTHGQLSDSTSSHPAPRTQPAAALALLRPLFAPPLSAYLVDSAGANLTQLEYIMRTKSINGTQILPAAQAHLLTPLVAARANRLQALARVGYTTLAPVGVNRTMYELDCDEARNLNFSDGNVSVDRSGVGPMVDVTDNSILEQPPEVDLDAAVRDMDDDAEWGAEGGAIVGGTVGDVSVGAAGVAGDDDGFMAEEVEYQDDHSISTRADDAGSGGPANAVSTSNILSAIQRGELSASGAPEWVEDVENENRVASEDDSEMVIE